MHPSWLTSSEIVRAVADRPEGPYTFAEVVLPARGPAYWDGMMTHNPHIVQYGKRYVLFYTGSTHPFPDVSPDEPLALDDPRVIVARSRKRIGVAVADRVEGPWLRRDEPLLPTRPGMFDSYFTSNAAPVVHEDGSILLMYKSRAYTTGTHEYSRMALGVAFFRTWMPLPRIVRRSRFFPNLFIWRILLYGQTLREDI